MDLVVDCYEWMGPWVDDGLVHGWTMDGMDRWMDGWKGMEGKGREGERRLDGWIVVIMD